jgi:hypothetical protein
MNYKEKSVGKKEEIYERRTGPEMRCDVAAFYTCDATTVLPLARQRKIIGALTTDMIVAEMVVTSIWICEERGESCQRHLWV